MADIVDALIRAGHGRGSAGVRSRSNQQARGHKPRQAAIETSRQSERSADSVWASRAGAGAKVRLDNAVLRDRSPEIRVGIDRAARRSGLAAVEIKYSAYSCSGGSPSAEIHVDAGKINASHALWNWRAEQNGSLATAEDF